MLDVNGNAFLIDFGQASLIKENDDPRKNFSAMKGVLTVSLKEEGLGPYYMNLMQYWPEFDQLIHEKDE